MLYKSYRFAAMASPCEVQFDTDDASLVAELGAAAEAEVARIEATYSRYRPDSLLSQVNRSSGAPVPITTEMMNLLHYSARCHELTDGLFDITCGVLRAIWKFDGSNNIPTQAQIDDLLQYVGWDKVTLTDHAITLRPGMEIDFGGLGKEYAVDRVRMLLAGMTDTPFLVNFGGDLCVSGPRRNGRPWRIAVDAVDTDCRDRTIIEIGEGALTTSGDAQRHILKNGKRYSHILNPKTGWPVNNPPRSVTVAASTCMEAGVLSTLAMALGEGAESFLHNERCLSWIIR